MHLKPDRSNQVTEQAARLTATTADSSPVPQTQRRIRANDRQSDRVDPAVAPPRGPSFSPPAQATLHELWRALAIRCRALVGFCGVMVDQEDLNRRATDPQCRPERPQPRMPIRRGPAVSPIHLSKSVPTRPQPLRRGMIHYTLFLHGVNPSRRNSGFETCRNSQTFFGYGTKHRYIAERTASA